MLSYNRLDNGLASMARGLALAIAAWTIFCNAALADSLVLENKSVRIDIDTRSGAFQTTEKATGQIWNPDPWQQAAGILTFQDPKGSEKEVNLSNSQKVEVRVAGNNVAKISFLDPLLPNGEVVKGGRVDVSLSLAADPAVLTAQVDQVKLPARYKAIKLQYPTRAFSLATDQDRGAGVIPFWQGLIVPSYIFPMTGGRFCQWDDAQFSKKAMGEMPFEGAGRVLSMPWFGTHSEKSAVLAVLEDNPPAEMTYILNHNGQSLFPRSVSPYPYILDLSPVWQLQKQERDFIVKFHFLPNGDHVSMAKRYRTIAKQRGHFVSLRDKLARNKDVDKLPGAHYIGIYGGYPHYVNMPGMAFNFSELDDMVRELREELNVDRAFLHVWGTWENYVPVMWPINEELGGAEQLKKVVDRAKGYGYLYSNYHSYTALLDHDPNLDLSLARRDANGEPRVTNQRWDMVDPKNYVKLAKSLLSKEMAALGQNADITDIAFIYSHIGKTAEENQNMVEFAEYLRSNGLVMGTERGGEQWIPYFEVFEGLTYNPNSGPIELHSHRAPLFSLVYHDAIANYGKIQDPDNVTTFRGDFRVKTLRNMLHGNGATIFFAPYEYEGMKPLIKMAEETLAPVHKETFYEELTDHDYLSADFKLQRSRFSNGVEVVANLGPVAQDMPDGTSVPAYGFRITGADGRIRGGAFSTTASVWSN